MSDTLSITLRSIDRRLLLENPTSENRFEAVKEKTRLIDAERLQNPYLEEIISSPEQLRADFTALRRRKYRGLLGRITPRLHDSDYNQQVTTVASVVENVNYLLTRPIQEQYALLSLGATLAADGIIIAGANYLNEESHIPTKIDPTQILFHITATGLALGAALQIATKNRNSYQMRALNAIAFVQANITMYNMCAPQLRKINFDEAQHNPDIVQWQNYDKPEFRVLKTPADVHPNVCDPKFKETKRTYFDVTYEQGVEFAKQTIAKFKKSQIS